MAIRYASAGSAFRLACRKKSTSDRPSPTANGLARKKPLRAALGRRQQFDNTENSSAPSAACRADPGTTPAVRCPGAARPGVDVEHAAAVVRKATHSVQPLQEREHLAEVAANPEIDGVAGEVVGA